MNAAEVLAEKPCMFAKLGQQSCIEQCPNEPDIWCPSCRRRRRAAKDLDALLSLAQPDAEGRRRVVLEGTGGADAEVRLLEEGEGEWVPCPNPWCQGGDVYSSMLTGTDVDECRTCKGNGVIGCPTYRLVASLPVHEEGER